MVAIETPQSFTVSQECQKAAWENGYRREMGEDEGWVRYGSTTAHGTVYLASSGPQGPWFLALDHTGVIEELHLPIAEMPGPGLSRYAFNSLNSLYEAMHRVYQLATCLPDAPLREFESQVKDLPKTTEVERLVVQRIGQDIFRKTLMDYWQGRCPLTGITDPALLRASHIIPWKACKTDAERLDIHNGLLLSALWDAAFDRGLVSFQDDGRPCFSPQLTDAAKQHLPTDSTLQGLTKAHQCHLQWHRQNIFVK